MIQVCSTCGTRWNVRDRRRVWCPRCNGTLLPPSGPDLAPQWRPTASGGAPPAGIGGRPAAPTTQQPARRLPPGYRWIAVRPGAPPPTRRVKRPLGPTPRYAFIPRWGLFDHFDATAGQPQTQPHVGPSTRMVRATLYVTMLVLGAAAFLHLVRYVFLIINRTVLLNPWVAGIVTWLGVAASVLAIFTVVASAIVLTNWLIGRRAAAFGFRGHQDPRGVWELRGGCLIPLVNLLWAPVFVIELARVEDRLNYLRKNIVAWWLMWVVSTVISIFSIATSFATDAQGIANNTVTTTIAYLAALAALLLMNKVFEGFERQPVERPSKRWVVIADKTTEADKAQSTEEDAAVEPETAVPVESEGQNPAA